ncbi:MAG: hypothetical protein GWO39_07925, partial [Gammaproteobacteria bacterium]|nr:hypothetical protein [Gemmatimonadota bacterium]NIR99303.1 hypothetical protein [Gammaproteobacteria bacterium]NIT63705.1 hypothetical protein [Gammaproteobacteria bacterium]NIV21890.1 hypothetical protein [Gammaproteobacteria bacterium]NIW77562.1 hypothetical protein [Gemmatimonadota bacterium]
EAEARQLFGENFQISFDVRSSGEAAPPVIPTMPVVGFEELDSDEPVSDPIETPPGPVVGTLNPRYTLENC